MKSFATLLLLLICLNNMASAQQKVLARFIITESTSNGWDNTAFDTDRGGVFVFYELKDGLYMSNYSKNTEDQSFGKLSNFDFKVYDETENLYRRDIYTCRWKYYNTYDDKTGYATISFIKIYKPQGVIFELKMVLPNLDVLAYKGYMEGSLNFDNFD